jgi:hypothetical protein
METLNDTSNVLSHVHEENNSHKTTGIHLLDVTSLHPLGKLLQNLSSIVFVHNFHDVPLGKYAL